MAKETVSFEDIKCIRSTDKAILVEVEGEEVWIPLSQVDDDSEVYEEGDEGTLVITQWIADKLGLS